MKFGFLDYNFLKNLLFIYFHQLNDELDELTKRYPDNVNYNLIIIIKTNPSHFLLTIPLKYYGKKSKFVDSNNNKNICNAQNFIKCSNAHDKIKNRIKKLKS